MPTPKRESSCSHPSSRCCTFVPRSDSSPSLSTNAPPPDAHRLEAGIKQFSADATGASTFPGGGQTLGGTPIPTEVPPAERNYTKLILIFLVAAWWAYSRGQK